MNNIENPNNYQGSENIEEMKKEIPNFEAMADSITIKKFLEDGDERIKATPEQCKHEYQKLETFLDAIGDCEYYIGGGLAVELEEKKIEHVHSDMDIIVFEDELEKIKEALESKEFSFEKNENIEGHDFDAKLKTNKEDEKLIDESLHIGIFAYKKNKESEMAEQLNEDGSINRKFPLDYFDAEKQTIEYDQHKLCVADIRLVLGNKLASERPKDLVDIKKIKELIILKYPDKEILRKEMERLQMISRENIRSRTVSSIKNIISKLADKKEITRDNIYGYFEEEVRHASDKIKIDKYKEAIDKFLQRLKNFTSDGERTERTFEEFALNNTGPLFDYFDDEIKMIIDNISDR